MSPAELQAYADGYQRRTNYEAWLDGMYCYDALCCVIQNAFRKKSDPPAKYPEKPYELFEREKTEAEKQKEAEEERKKAIAYFNSFAKHKKKLEFQDPEEAERLKARLYMHQMMWSCKNLGNKK